MTAEPLDDEKGHKELTKELAEGKDYVCKLKIEVYELQSMKTEKANMLKSFTIFVEKEEKEDCENSKENTLNKSDLDQQASKYNK